MRPTPVIFPANGHDNPARLVVSVVSHGPRAGNPETVAATRTLLRGQRDACGVDAQRARGPAGAVPRPVWLDLGGFDPTYFMYCEDVDLCLRMRLAGLALVRGPAEVVHAGYRASHRRWSHLRWHVLSLLRLWRSPTYHRARPLLATGRG
jgi:GT2 family glycosyltransferase